MKVHILNVPAIVLMLLIAGGLYFSSRITYDNVVAEQALLKERQRTLEERVASALTRSNSAFDDLTASLDGLTESYAAISEAISLQTHTVSELQARLAALEQRILTGDAVPSTAVTTRDLFTDEYTSPIQLSKELRESADRVSPRVLEEARSSEALLSFALGSGLIEYENREAVPSEVVAAFERLYSRYKDCMSLLTQQEKVRIHALMAQADQEGDYVDIPRDVPDTQKVLEETGFTERGMGITQMITIKELDVRRFYSFPYERHNEFVKLGEMRDNARDHLVRDLSLIR
jgi:hypothetical protein